MTPRGIAATAVRRGSAGRRANRCAGQRRRRTPARPAGRAPLARTGSDPGRGRRSDRAVAHLRRCPRSPAPGRRGSDRAGPRRRRRLTITPSAPGTKRRPCTGRPATMTWNSSTRPDRRRSGCRGARLLDRIGAAAAVGHRLRSVGRREASRRAARRQHFRGRVPRPAAGASPVRQRHAAADRRRARRSLVERQSRGSASSRQYLVSSGAEINWGAPWSGETPFDAATAGRQPQMAAWLAARSGHPGISAQDARPIG